MYKVCCIIAGIALFLPLWVLAQPSPYSATETFAAVRDTRSLLIFDTERSGAPAGGPVWTGLRRQFCVDDREFTVALLGRDGDEEFRSHVPVTIEKLDALIDVMPMQQQEVRDELSPK
jgi:hypothetical protein